MNSINLIGNICNDLELKVTDSGKNVCSFNIAVKRPYVKDVTDFIRVVCWNKQAEIISQYCHKGNRIGLSGILTSRSYQDKEGNNRTVFEVVANEIEFLEKRVDGNSNDAPSVTAPTNDFVPIPDESDLPF